MLVRLVTALSPFADETGDEAVHGDGRVEGDAKVFVGMEVIGDYWPFHYLLEGPPGVEVMTINAQLVKRIVIKVLPDVFGAVWAHTGSLQATGPGN